MKKGTVTLIGLFVLGILIGCQKRECCAIVDNQIDIEYIDESGASLFQTDTNYNPDQIKIYYEGSNGYEYMYNPSLDLPRYYSVDSSFGKVIIRLEPSFYYSGNKSTTLIQLSDNDTDTLIGQFKLEGNSTYLEKVWYNGNVAANRYLVVRK